MNIPRVSVIVPIFNVESYLPKCIESIINQTYKNIEIILVNDGSPDNCPKICDNYAKIDNRIKVIHVENGGLSWARNLGLKVATGDYITFVDSDDWIEIDMYEVLVTSLMKNNADIAICGHNIVKNGKVIDAIHNDNTVVTYTKKQAMEEILRDRKINSFAWDKLYKRSLFNDLNYPSLSYHEDLAFTFKVINKSNKIVCINKPKYNYVRNSNSICLTLSPTKRYDSYLAYRERQKLIDIEYPLIKEFNEEKMYIAAFVALNFMIRTGEYKKECNKQFKILILEIKKDVEKIKANKKINKKFKILSRILMLNEQLYIFIMKINFKRLVMIKK